MPNTTNWLLVKDMENGDLNVIPTSQPFHENGPDCWCGAVELEPELWVHNEQN